METSTFATPAAARNMHNVEIKVKLSPESYQLYVDTKHDVSLWGELFGDIKQTDTYYRDPLETDGRYFKVRSETNADPSSRCHELASRGREDTSTTAIAYERSALVSSPKASKTELISVPSCVRDLFSFMLRNMFACVKAVEKVRTVHINRMGGFYTRVHIDRVSGLPDIYLELEIVLQPTQTEAEGRVQGAIAAPPRNRGGRPVVQTPHACRVSRHWL